MSHPGREPTFRLACRRSLPLEQIVERVGYNSTGSDTASRKVDHAWLVSRTNSRWIWLLPLAPPSTCQSWIMCVPSTRRQVVV